jgi:transcriptional regulator with XRE-family HTH domain
MEESMTQPMPSTLQYVVETKSVAELPLTVSTSRLLSELSNKAYRDAYVGAQIRIGLPFQVKALRTARNWSQGELALHAGMAQPRISEIERPGERSLNLDTLLRLASAFDCALEVRFTPFSQLVRDSESFDPENFAVPTFQHELDFGWFSESAVPSVIFCGTFSYQEVIVRPEELVEFNAIGTFNLVVFAPPPQTPICISITPE